MRKALPIVAAAALVALAACSQQPQAAAAPGHYEVLYLSGSKAYQGILMRVNVTTGASWIDCCGDSDFVAIKDDTPAPAGDYHARGASTLESDGSVTWDAFRFDSVSGRTWVLSSPPYHWIEKAPPASGS